MTKWWQCVKIWLRVGGHGGHAKKHDVKVLEIAIRILCVCRWVHVGVG